MLASDKIFFGLNVSAAGALIPKNFIRIVNLVAGAIGAKGLDLSFYFGRLGRDSKQAGQESEYSFHKGL